MGVIKLFLILLGLILAGGVALYFSPDSVKERGLAYISDRSIIPEDVKKVAESIYATPSMKREQLVQEFERNLADIQKVVEKSSPAPEAEATVKLIEETKKIVEEIIEQKAEPSVIQQITETVTAKLLKSGEVTSRPVNCD